MLHFSWGKLSDLLKFTTVREGRPESKADHKSICSLRTTGTRRWYSSRHHGEPMQNTDVQSCRGGDVTGGDFGGLT